MNVSNAPMTATDGSEGKSGTPTRTNTTIKKNAAMASGLRRRIIVRTASSVMSSKNAGLPVFAEPPNFGSETRKYVITPIETSPEYDTLLAGVPGDRTLSKGVRLPPNTNPEAEHYLILQNRQPGTAFSQNLPANGGGTKSGLYIEDAITPPHWIPHILGSTSRNVVHPLTNQATVGADADVVPIVDAAPNPDVQLISAFPKFDGINVDIVGELPGPGAFSGSKSLLVDVTRQQKNFLDLFITPWGAPRPSCTRIGSRVSSATSNGRSTRNSCPRFAAWATFPVLFPRRRSAASVLGRWKNCSRMAVQPNTTPR